MAVYTDLNRAAALHVPALPSDLYLKMGRFSFVHNSFITIGGDPMTGVVL